MKALTSFYNENVTSGQPERLPSQPKFTIHGRGGFGENWYYKNYNSNVFISIHHFAQTSMLTSQVKRQPW